ncbi:hypothetical protein Mal4_27420 [Maioricimonas rarisocia]|uniref:Uncharacterized protein n=1 Tax=Maioricimonas rarisocia TaxID=2528026 RepID=A0A517Z7G3_9PLAN|nr:hypothetical protein [Maioricimonas rarisocia]QDU38415.1 hypothetical protein Mal4_27420 [Maioricimonas rarisocia]
MLIERAEQLKRELTDKYVVVSDNVAELRRFVGLTGRVKTVNMNCRALVEFDGPVDIGWYDIDPTYLRVVDEPVRKEAKAAPAAEKKKTEVASAKPTGKSPLELARQQGAAGSTATKPAEAGKKPSPLELARQQGAAKSSDAAPAASAAESKPSAPAEGGKKLSPLEMARQQGAAKQGDEPAAAAPSEQDAPQAEVATESQPASKPPAKSDESTAGLSKLELARRQGPFKG